MSSEPARPLKGASAPRPWLWQRLRSVSAGRRRRRLGASAGAPLAGSHAGH
jgi:hypothetical protein